MTLPKPCETIKTFLEENPKKNLEYLNNPEFLSILANHLIGDTSTEEKLTHLRQHCLTALSQQNNGQTLWNNALIFLNALALQCFFNEYIFFETQQEKELLSKLEQRIIKGQNLTLYDIAIYACYRPLHPLPRAQNLLTKLSSLDVMSHFTRILLAEPLEEMEIKKTIPTLTSIDDEISKLVKSQYEENPYPRWQNIRPPAKSLPFKETLQINFPHLNDEGFTHINRKKTRTLIAGCGTGIQSINASLDIKNADILAVDLSASSIAYAIRKTREYNINNIEYGIGDILKLEEIGEKFDVIQCGGVLHHMHDPEKGWRVLNNCLKPGGFMCIALYSNIARKQIVAAQNFIKENDFTSDIEGIRLGRKAIMALPENNPAKAVIQRLDFYSASCCRDLIFHVQEHRYTLPEIKNILKKLNLEFLGFLLGPNSSEIIQHYTQKFPDDPAMLNLENWNQFERQNPGTFIGMYQFWLQKPA